MFFEKKADENVDEFIICIPPLVLKRCKVYMHLSSGEAKEAYFSAYVREDSSIKYRLLENLQGGGRFLIFDDGTAINKDLIERIEIKEEL